MFPARLPFTYSWDGALKKRAPHFKYPLEAAEDRNATISVHNPTATHIKLSCEQLIALPASRFSSLPLIKIRLASSPHGRLVEHLNTAAYTSLRHTSPCRQ